MNRGLPADFPSGEACVLQLPVDATIASCARTSLGSIMSALRLSHDLISDGQLAISEVATNVHQHAHGSEPSASLAPPELWVWARMHPAPQLVVSVFDADRDVMPVRTQAALLDEYGKGLGIVDSVCDEWGAHLSRCRLGSQLIHGKATWFALPLPQTWTRRLPSIQPAAAAHRLLLVLGARGITASRRSDSAGISIVTVNDLNVWVEPKSFSWRDGDGYTRHPLIDLQEAAEQIVRVIEEADAVSAN